MNLPYHLLKVCGSVVFAAQGSDIHSFSSTLEHISTWKYPMPQAGDSNGADEEAVDSPAPEGPPAKRRKVEDKPEHGSNSHGPDSTNGQPKSKKAAQYDNPANERPFVQGLYATTDGRHLIAITGSDKTIWAFEHDGAGNLKQLSQRAMPKRPCSLTLTHDNRTILSADKFGDVYALPLIPTDTPSAAQEPAVDPPKSRSASATPSTSAPTPTTASAPLRPQADPLTVHTKRNLRALEHQKISLSRNALQEQQNRVQFEHTLLLGHVSMLTAICVGTTTTTTTTTTSQAADGTGAEEAVREYIITADRDEHIRVTRSMPQTHVIEGFCLGHEDFVSRLCVAPGGREGVLISGGGDDYLFVWDWVNGRLLGKAGVLEHVRGVAGEEASKVAVTRVLGWRWEGGGEGGKTAVFVVVERVPALFCYELLDDNSLRHRETICLPGNPLDVEVMEPSGATTLPCLLVALDPGEESNSSTLVVLDKEGEGWRQSQVGNLPTGGGTKISAAELHKILYSTESLRKISDFD